MTPNIYFRSPWNEEIDNKNHSEKPTPVKLSNYSKSQSSLLLNPLGKISTMSRSVSQDIAVIGSISKAKNSTSDTALNTECSSKQIPKKESQLALHEDDVCSTDSSVLDEVDAKKKKRKIFTFTKKNKNKRD